MGLSEDSVAALAGMIWGIAFGPAPCRTSTMSGKQVLIRLIHCYCNER